MSAPAGSVRASRVSWRFISLLIAGVGVALLVAANVHLVYVAFDSQPECVPHEKVAGNGSYSAARSAC